MNWWRCFHGMPTSAKLAMVADLASAKRCEVGWIWLFLLDRASKSEPRGSISGYETEVIAYQGQIEVSVVERIIESMKMRGLIDSSLIISSWEEKQPIDKTATERKRRERERKRDVTNVTRDNRDVTVVTVGHTEEKRVEEKRKQQPQPVRFTEYPKTLSAVCSKFPTSDVLLVQKIVDAGAQAYVSVKDPKIPEPTDDDYAAAVESAFSGSPSQNSAGLFIRTVPTVISTWARQGRNGHNASRYVKPL